MTSEQGFGWKECQCQPWIHICLVMPKCYNGIHYATQKKQSSEIRTTQNTALYPRKQNSKVSHFSHQITQAVTNSKGSMLKGLLSTKRERIRFYKPNIMFSFIKSGNWARPDCRHSIWSFRNIYFTAEPPH